MHVLFLHPNYPAQFGQIAMHLARQHGYRCTFVSEKVVADSPEIQHVRFQACGGARQETHYCVRSFENQVARSQGVYEALRQRPDIRPDLIVGHSGFASTLFLRELYDAPIIQYFEYFYHARGSDFDFRSDLPPPAEMDRLRLRARNATLLLDLHNCDAGYAPTDFQRAQLPVEYQAKVRCIFDGIDTSFWKPVGSPSRRVAGVEVPADHQVVTYVSRGLESLRGFDIFMRVAAGICRQRSDVTVLVVGEDRVAYGGDARFTGGKTFKQWVLENNDFDLSRIHFVGRIPPSQLVSLFSLSDLHLYFTAPFVLSWSLLNALSCGATVLASGTAPVREIIQHEVHGLLCDFFDVDRWVGAALEVLDRPQRFRSLGVAGRQLVERKYALPECLAQMRQLYQEVTRSHGA